VPLRLVLGVLFGFGLACFGDEEEAASSAPAAVSTAPTIPVLRDPNTMVDPSFLSDPGEYMAMMEGGDGSVITSLEGVRASSTLPPQGKNRYEAKRMHDVNQNTAWVEGDAEYGIGESITWRSRVEDPELDIPCESLMLMNGYQKSQSHMEKNSRIKTMDMYVDDHLTRRLEIQDRLGYQYFSAEDLGLKNGQNVKLVITGVYKGTKWKDTAISEMTAGCYYEM